MLTEYNLFLTENNLSTAKQEFDMAPYLILNNNVLAMDDWTIELIKTTGTFQELLFDHINIINWERVRPDHSKTVIIKNVHVSYILPPLANNNDQAIKYTYLSWPGNVSLHFSSQVYRCR